MPGLFGAIGCDPDLREGLRRRFLTSWEDSEVVTFPNGIMGGHSFGNASALHKLDDGTHFVIDGERSIYRLETPPFRLSPTLQIASSCRGNVAIVTHDLCYLATDWSGGFPLYYARVPGGILFCSLLRPIAQTLRTDLDIVGLRQFLHACYMLSGRTFYKGISRLMPGQILTYDPSSNRSTIVETSKAWVGLELNSPSELWNRLMAAISSSFDRDCRNAVMVSGGWDSRTLLAAAKNYLSVENLLAYCHGGKDSFEGKIAQDVSQMLGIKFHYEPLSEELFRPEILKRGFERVETVVFPEWHRAGLLMLTLGVDCVSSGVFGEILGGHYSRTMLCNGAKKLLAFQMQALGWNSSMENILDALMIHQLVNPWTVNPEIWGNIDALRKTMNGDIECTLNRYIDRGVQSSDQLVEAFIAEHRGSQHINSQMLSCRAYLDVSIPFADREFLLQTSRMPIAAKLHNTLNRRLLHQYCQKILKFPTAAAPVSASMPILIQELARLLRRIGKGRTAGHPVGWWDWEFLRDGIILNKIVDDLELAFWNKKAIRERISDLQRNKSESVGLLMQRLLIVYSVDLMLRNQP